MSTQGVPMCVRVVSTCATDGHVVVVLFCAQEVTNVHFYVVKCAEAEQGTR